MDKQRFAVLVMEQEKTLYRVARSILRDLPDQQDAVQEALTKAWAKRYTLREEKYFSTWLVRILINECNSIHRKKSRFVLRGTWEDVSLGITPLLSNEELNEAIDALRERLRIPFVLHYVEGFKIKDIASMLHCTQGSIRSRLSNARKALRTEIEHGKEAQTK